MSDRAPAEDAGEELDLGEIDEVEEAEIDEVDAADEGDADLGDPDEGEEEGEDVAAAPRRGGGASTPRNLRRRAQEAERERDELRGRIDSLQRSQQQIEQRLAADPQAQQRAEAAEAAQLEMMSPAEQARYFYQKGQREFGGALRNIQAQNADEIDRLGYEAAGRTSPLHQRYKDRVEEVLRFEHSQGRSQRREVILDYLIGRDVREKSERAAPAQRRQAGARVRSQTTRPGAARGDAGTGRGTRRNDDSIAATRDRLKGQPLW